ncbi:tyrosine-type recombinase/integrase [Nitrosopumilus sp.]|uniref:tyrosine-type recombinase/integrase n=1 Tax=Nitrosopumilus sp. TaxID=2024843 RepID=UPI00260EA21A|nr:tyrosine-type recombinase/integrase [Nitrosopumilus sp.]
MAQKRCLVMFLQALGSPVTRENYKYQLDRFMEWNKTHDYDDLLKADEKTLQRNLEDYLIYLKDNFSPNYIPSIMQPVELFYTMNDVNLNTKRLHKMFPTRTKKGGYGTYKREDIQKMLLATKKKRTRALILFLSSTGCRVGVIPELKLGHITNIDDCKKVVCYAGDKEEYVTFMTPESSKAFDDYLDERQQDNERLTPESPAFRKDYVIGSAPAETMLQGTVRNALTITLKDVQKTKTGNRFNIPTLHGLRKYFNITLKSRANANLSICEKLMGHSVTIPLDNHYAPFSDEALFEEYKKAILDLTISNEDRQRQEIESNKKEIENLNKEKSEWEKERAEKEHEYAKRIKEEILKELKDPSNSDKSLKEQLDSNRKQSEKIKDDVGF